MPNINSIPEVLYEPNQPYHYYYDNLPLRNILTRIGLVNIQVDRNSDVIRGAAGTAGSIDARLNVSLQEDGTLKMSAVDAAEHGIGHHTDGAGPDSVEYVRMRADERAKLELVESEANRLYVEVEDQHPTVGPNVVLSSGTLRLRRSSTIFFDFEAPDVVRAHSAFPPDTAHRHHYSLAPAHQNPSSPDYRNYRTTSVSTPYMAGTLRVCVNGVRLYGSGVPVPNHNATSFSSTYVASEDNLEGTFSLNRSLSSSDVVRIDFDESFAAEEGSSSSSSSSSVDCSMFLDCDPVNGMASSDCGLLPMPGYTQYFDCDLCECVAVPISSSSS